VRTYPALELSWPTRPDDSHIERLLAEIDADAPTAVEERGETIRIFFASADSRHRAAIRLIAVDPEAVCRPLDVPDEDWAARSQADLEPVTIGRLTIDPREPGAGVHVATDVILIKPSMGFGTGHHASTRLCLTLLQRLPLGGRRVLDVGTGSGILAIAAVRLGAAAALGIDHDEDALTAARESVAANGASASVTLAAVDLTRPGAIAGAPFDVVVANLTDALLIREAAALAGALTLGGHLIASGFMAEDADGVASAFVRAGLTATARADELGWVAVTARRAQ
jgi:ribosomal protein L11 methyltransferase